MSDEHRPDRYPLPPELAAVERRLAGLTPAVPRIDRDRLMFEAGRAAAEVEFYAPHPAGARLRGAAERCEPSPSLGGRGTRWFWPAATATMTAATVLLAVMLARQERPAQVPQLAGVPQVSPASAAPSVRGGADEMYMLAASQRAWPLGGQPTSGYLGVRYVVLTQGVEALAALQPAVIGEGGAGRPTRPPTARQLLDQMLPNRS